MPITGTLHLLTFSHRDTSLEVRDRLAFSNDQARDLIAEIRRRYDDECAVLSTCNRTEFYYYGDLDSDDNPWQRLRPHIDDIKGIGTAELAAPTHRHGLDAARHLFRVAASLESIALGENEILAQIKRAHQLVIGDEGSTQALDQLFQYAIRAGKEVRTDTALCEGAISISSVAVDLAEKIFGELDDHLVALIGAGETAETAAHHFVSAGVSDFIVLNRTEERGRSLAEELGGVYRPLEATDDVLGKADVLVVATGSQEYLVEPEQVRRARRHRSGRPMFLIDISNPRNVDPDIGELDGAFLYNMNDLQGIVANNRASREDEIPAAEGIVDRFVQRWDDWRRRLLVTPTISTLARYFEDARQRELDRHPDLAGEERKRLEQFSKGLIKKLLHDPITHLRAAVDDGTLTSDQLEFVWSLYNLREFEERSDDS